MTSYQVTATLTWKFDSTATQDECFEFAKAQIEKLINTDPHGENFSDFSIQMSLTKMKSRNRMISLASYDVDEILNKVTSQEHREEFSVNGSSYNVRMNSERYHVFKKNRQCVCCGLLGTRMVLEMHSAEDSSPHFNLYGKEKGRLILMTKDHIIAKSKGGSDHLDNFRTMCVICNNLRGNSDISIEQIKNLRDLYVKNPEKLPKKMLMAKIISLKEEYENALVDTTKGANNE